MNTSSFLDALRRTFDDFPNDPLPRDPLFERILDEVGGLAKPNNLALIAAATSALASAESYVEAGSLKGASLIAAAYGKQGDFVGIDDFSMAQGSRELLAANLRAFDCSHATVIESDVFEALGDGSLDGRRVGVYYYDAAHGRQQTLAGLRLIEPYLSDESVLVVDDTDWERVEHAVDDYLGSQPKATELLRVRGKDHGNPAWWEGMRVLSWSARGRVAAAPR
jgi:protein O-GlcNAc transferase